MKFRFATAAAALAVATVPHVARAADIPCEPVDNGVINVDGLLDDWNEVTGLVIGGDNANFSFTAKCNYDHDALYLLVDVRDDMLARGKLALPTEDHVDVVFAAAPGSAKLETLSVYPGDSASGVPHKIFFASGRSLSGIEEMDALQAKGWAVELRFAFSSLPGYAPGMPSIKLGIGALDSDEKINDKPNGKLAGKHGAKTKARKPKRRAKTKLTKVAKNAKNALVFKYTLSTSPLDSTAHLGTTLFAEPGALLAAFLDSRSLTEKDVRFDLAGRVLPSGGGRVVLAGKTLALIGDEYFYVDLPVAQPSDVLDVKLADLAGDGRDAVVVRYREAEGGFGHEVVAAYRMSGEGLHRVFGVEAARWRGQKRIQNKVTLAAKRGGGMEIVVEPGTVVGWTEADYHEEPVEELVPVLLPWGVDKNLKKQRFAFRGDEYFRAD